MIRLAVRVRRADAEIVLAELLELAPDGVEETQLDEETVEYAVYGAPGELPSLPDLKAATGGSLVDIATSETADDWGERWRQFHRPIMVQAPARAFDVGSSGSAQQSHPAQSGAARSRSTPSLYVRPPWEPPAAAEGVEEIVIDPGQAFGTGAHATTRLCLELLLEMASLGLASGPLVDVGTGSGVLAIAAARLGFAPVLALDHDLLSIDAARANAAINGAELTLARFDLRRDTLPRPAPVILANLLLPLLLELSRTISEAPSQLIASGLLRGQVDEVVETYGSHFELRERRRLHAGEWAAVWLSGG